MEKEIEKWIGFMKYDIPNMAACINLDRAHFPDEVVEQMETCAMMEVIRRGFAVKK